MSEAISLQSEDKRYYDLKQWIGNNLDQYGISDISDIEQMTEKEILASGIIQEEKLPTLKWFLLDEGITLRKYSQDEDFWKYLGPDHYKALFKAGLRRNRDLENITIYEFAELTGYGERGIRRIESKMKKYGLHFKKH